MKSDQKALENAENRVMEEKIRLKDVVDEHDRQVNQLKVWITRDCLVIDFHLNILLCCRFSLKMKSIPS